MDLCNDNYKKTEVAVVGGGPAGAWCAYLVACSGIPVSLMHWSGYAPGGIELVSGRARRQIEPQVDILLDFIYGGGINGGDRQ